MVSFQCDGCADTVKKPKLDQHRQRCWASFTCLDCSKTFQNQDYKSHTSCISEAEKYQGALYKGPKKGQQHKPQHQPPASTFTSAPAPDTSAASSPAPPAIHPSRMNQVDAASSGQYQAPYPSRGGPSGRGGAMRGGPAGGRGFGGRGSGRFPAITGENKATPQNGMRSWGSPVVTDSQPASPSQTSIPNADAPSASASGVSQPAATDAAKKKNKKKGDKGGTGSKANSKRPKGDDETTPAPNGSTTTSDEPAAKKRKRSASPPAAAQATAQTTSAEISDKTLKRLRKNSSKVAEKTTSLSLGDWLKSVGESKKESVDAGDVNRAAKVSWEDGKWVLSF